MPQLASDGKWVGGIAGVGVYHQDKTIWGPGEGGGAQSLFNDEVIGQRTFPDTPLGLYSHNLLSGNDWLLFEGPVYYVGASRNGHWVIRTNEGTLSVVRDSFGRKFNGAGVSGKAMGPDGSYIMKRLYHSSGPYDVVEPDGSAWELTPGDAFIFANYGDKRVTWLDEAGWHGVGVPDPLPLSAPAYSFRYVFWGDELWQLYQMEDGRLVLHPRGDPHGYEVAPSGDAFTPDWLVLPDGQLRVVWSVREGEDPGSIRVRDLDKLDLREDLTFEELLPVDRITLQERPFAVGPFMFNDYSSESSLGNTFLPIRTKMFWDGDIATVDQLDSHIRPYALWAGEGGGEGRLEDIIKALRPRAEELGVGLVVYQDSPIIRKSALLLTKPEDIIAPQFYREPNETTAHFIDRVLEESHRLEEYRLMPVVSIYDRNKTLSDAEIVETLIVTSAIADMDKWFGMLLFRIGTSDGLTDTTHTALRPYIERLVSGAVGRPPAPKPEEKPTVMNTRISHLVTAFPDDDFDKPIETRPAATEGPWEDVEVVKNSDGTYSIRNTKGTEWLSVQREGTIQSRPTSDPAQPRSWEKFDKRGNTLVERNKDAYGGFVPPTRHPVTFLVAGSL